MGWSTTIAGYVEVSEEMLSDIKSLKWYFKKIILFKKIKRIKDLRRRKLF